MTITPTVHTLPYKDCIPWSLRSEISAESRHPRTLPKFRIGAPSAYTALQGLHTLVAPVRNFGRVQENSNGQRTTTEKKRNLYFPYSFIIVVRCPLDFSRTLPKFRTGAPSAYTALQGLHTLVAPIRNFGRVRTFADHGSWSSHAISHARFSTRATQRNRKSHHESSIWCLSLRLLSALSLWLV